MEIDKNQEEQINALLGDEDESVEEGESEASNSSEEAGSEVSAETEESPNSEETEEVSEVEGKTSDDEEEGGDDETKESDDSVSEIDALRAEVDRLASLVNQPKKEESSSEESSISTPNRGLDVESLFNDDFDFDSVIESEDKFKSFLTDFAKKVQSSTHETILQTLPDTVSSYVNEQVTIKDQVNNFYRDNPDLENTKKYVSVTANEIASEHPDWDFSAVLDETAKKVRKSLGLKQDAKKSSSDKGQKKSPALAKGTKGQSLKKKPKQELSAMEQEIAELLEED